MFKKSLCLLSAGFLLASPGLGRAGERWWSGDWYVSLGAEGFVAPKFEGADGRKLQFAPLISLGKAGHAVRFSSRNDSASLGLIDYGAVRAGFTGKFIPSRDSGTAKELAGLKPVPWGVELGGFAEVYPSDWLRVRGEVRQGIRSHDGVVADLAVDAFTDVVPNLRLSGGPRATFASRAFNKAYYGVNAKQSAESGLSQYSPGDGLHSLGAGAALTWQATDAVSLSSFVEYKHLMGPAADSSLVRERGSRNQMLIGISANYKFGFTLD